MPPNKRSNVRRSSRRHKIQKVMRIKAPVETVATLIEDIKRTPDWNPLISEITVSRGRALAKGSTLEWKAGPTGMRIPGLGDVRIDGHSVATVWKPGHEYAWKNTDRVMGLSLEGRFQLEPVDGETKLIATVSYALPAGLGPLLNKLQVNRLLAKAVQIALKNIDTIASVAS